MPIKILMPDDDGDSKEKMRKLLEENQRELTAAQIIKGYTAPAKAPTERR